MIALVLFVAIVALVIQSARLRWTRDRLRAARDELCLLRPRRKRWDASSGREILVDDPEDENWLR